jgi:hypothetical protein
MLQSQKIASDAKKQLNTVTQHILIRPSYIVRNNMVFEGGLTKILDDRYSSYNMSTSIRKD